MKKRDVPNSKKPTPLFVAPRRPPCPICGKSSYSLGGVHPQCSVARESAQDQAALRAEVKASVAADPQAASSWTKSCVRCGKKIRARRMTCDCGYIFAPVMPLLGRREAGVFVPNSLAAPAASAEVDGERSIQSSDTLLAALVNRRLSRQGFRAPCQIIVGVAHGHVTLNGSVQRAQQKAAAIQATTAIPGVNRVIDRLVIKANIKQ